jgi:ribose transport system permease protein
VVWAATFAASAGCAAIAGILLAGFSGGADASVGQPYLFQTVATVVVGGTALLGGSGSYGRTFAGTLIITELTTILIGLGYSDRVQQIMLGVRIVLLVALYGRDAHVRNQI